jgi:FAD:protein FMN transferase
MKSASSSLRRAKPLLGTFVEITATGLPAADGEAAVEAAFEAIALIHDLMSFHEPLSDVSRINRTEPNEIVIVHPWTFAVLEAAAEVNRHSGGVFDICVAPALQELGLLPGRRAREQLRPQLDGSGGAIALMPGCRVSRASAGVGIDLGGIAKGFAIDRAVDTLHRHGVASGLVNAGGDIGAFGPEEHRVDIRDPADRSRRLCHIGLRNGAVASSANAACATRSQVMPGSHIIDPRDCKPTGFLLGASVIAASGTIADALTKVVMIEGAAALPVLARYGASALIMSPTGDVQTTADWPKACSDEA